MSGSSLYHLTKSQYKDVLSKFGTYTNYLLTKNKTQRHETFINNSIKKCQFHLQQRKLNLLKPPLIYEGPINVKYWIRRRRSGARK